MINFETKSNEASFEDTDMDEKVGHTNPRNGRTIDGALARLVVRQFGRKLRRDHTREERRKGAGFACCSVRPSDGIYTMQSLTRRDKYAMNLVSKKGKERMESATAFARDRPT